MTIKTMSIKDFRAEGFLQEANRMFFHPLGLALSVSIDDDGVETLDAVWDYRDDPMGIIFHPGAISKKRIDHVNSLRERKIEARAAILGGMIQQPEGE
jgi:hypothetical protein